MNSREEATHGIKAADLRWFAFKTDEDGRKQESKLLHFKLLSMLSVFSLWLSKVSCWPQKAQTSGSACCTSLLFVLCYGCTILIFFSLFALCAPVWWNFVEIRGRICCGSASIFLCLFYPMRIRMECAVLLVRM